jgi:hypothetical protein
MQLRTGTSDAPDLVNGSAVEAYTQPDNLMQPENQLVHALHAPKRDLLALLYVSLDHKC